MNSNAVRKFQFPEVQAKLVARNTLLNLLGQGLPLLAAVVTVPLIVKGLGAERFGILALGLAMFGYLSVFDFGLSRGMTKYVAELFGRGEERYVPTLVWIVVAFQVVLGIVACLVIISLTPFLIGKFLKIPSALMREAQLSVYVLSISAPIVFASGSFRGVLEAAQRFDLVNLVRVPFALANFLLPLIGIQLGLELPPILLLLVISQFLSMATLCMLCLRNVPSLASFPNFMQVRRMRKTIHFGGWVTLLNFLSPFLRHLDRFVIGALVSLSAVTYYALPFEIVWQFLVISASLGQTLFPAFSLLGTAQRQKLQDLYVRSLKYLILISGPLLLTLVLFSRDLLLVWLGVDFAERSGTVFQIFLACAFISTLTLISGTLIQALGRPDIIAKLYLIYLVPNAIIVCLLVGFFGIVGAALSVFFRTLVDFVLLSFSAAKISGTTMTIAKDNGLWRAAMTVVCLGFSFGCIYFLPTLSQKGLAMTVSLALYSLIVWKIGLDCRDKMVIRNLLQIPVQNTHL